MILCNKVKKIFFKFNFYNKFFLFSHNAPVSKVLYPLDSRRLIKIGGSDTPVFLQGLITNDMRHFEEGANSMYAMFLNNKGRVLYDTLIHKWEDGKSFMIECDKVIVTSLMKHLKLYKLKRNVEIEDVSEHFRLWSLNSSDDSLDYIIDPKKSINIYKDPRLCDLGCRLLCTTTLEGTQIAEKISNNIVTECKEDGYKYLRYKLGVSEGSEEMPPGTCFPLEVNCDYLHGVSFHKGCYIGQELTARVHHTGVVRKRIMPLIINQIPNENLEKDMIISASNNPNTNLGKLKGFFNDSGIGLVRIKEALEACMLNIGNHKVRVLKPSWWPVEAPKEKVITKNE